MINVGLVPSNFINICCYETDWRLTIKIVIQIIRHTLRKSSMQLLHILLWYNATNALKDKLWAHLGTSTARGFYPNFSSLNGFHLATVKDRKWFSTLDGKKNVGNIRGGRWIMVTFFIFFALPKQWNPWRDENENVFYGKECSRAL